ncbi:hypothetical protein CH259_12235 [Rhodococcus sp. 05-2254-4]|nr:hypothetical protein CH259_12235 [Rhodococcus sp. 05-2254-4]OZE40739.1 hypothetical protein CH261_27200 [Rhodococcus sp. 05-2254-3]OZE45730.1 hypothetical protein CH283_25855 [Rhodococcus sp. 05-2254-2]
MRTAAVKDGLVHLPRNTFTVSRAGFDAASFFVKDEAHVQALPGRAVKMVRGHLREYNVV